LLILDLDVGIILRQMEPEAGCCERDNELLGSVKTVTSYDALATVCGKGGF
jgi:hypothetical protein